MAKQSLFLILISIPFIIGCRKQAAPPLFIFGDSLFDAGNNNYINTSTLDQANFWPYGISYFRHPTGRFSDGRLIPDVIAEHAELPLVPPYLQQRNYQEYLHNYNGVNFASAGAGALSETFQGLVINLKTQLNYYKREIAELSKKIGKAEAARISSTAVYMFSIGSNDYMSPFLLNSTILSSYPHSTYVDMVLGNLSTVVKAIHKKGGRKFIFLNLGELGCFPGLRILNPETDGGCLEEVSELSKLHNNKLKTFLVKMEQQLYGFKYFLYDFKTSLAEKTTQPLKYGIHTHTMYISVLARPSSFFNEACLAGFEEGRMACCGTGRLNAVFSCGGKRLVKEFQVCENPNKYVFWDSYHLTERVYKQMADEMWNASTDRNNSLKELFLCF
ncbi:GDSL esterase/lipase 5-like isoform X1 [Salvia splendens]|uniref:GDSL esterase/lipase 5-like isoform X1 n=1 Tax=Salvia splendens TaxID=180675 RepID=UPI001C28137A|nr:GDSL esterase/lipase 5-like isoform X1 [Salvia splendens]